jgi:cell fate regulator YaaT (PSP1 superfamily)
MSENTDDIICKVAITDAIQLDCIGPASLGLKKNDWCIVKCERHDDYGRVTHVGGTPPIGYDLRNAPKLSRRATLVDQGKAHENQVRSKGFHRTAVEKIAAHDLPMRLVGTHYAFDRKLVIFLFTAPGRVDFRELLKDLNSALQTRVELRQIGPRDQAGVIGGLGTCGRALCCSTFLTNFVSINVKMAKDQGISLNPSNIIGACGRLKCCLAYEHEGYKLLLKSLPRVGTKCSCNGCDGKIIDRNPLTQTVRVALEDGSVVTVNADEVVTA